MTIDDQPDSNEAQGRKVPPADVLYRARQKRGEFYDGTAPVEYPELEAVAEFLATPKAIREIKTFTDLAKHLNVSRMTIYRWTQDEDVLRRAEYLLSQNKLKGDLVARLHWSRIVMAQVRAAIKGDTKAAEFCQKHTWDRNTLP